MKTGKIIIETTTDMPGEFWEKLEDWLATALSGLWGLEGSIEDEITGNSTQIRIIEEDL